MQSDLAIQKDIISTEKVSANIRLKIYSDAYQSRLVEALASNYPILQTYLGDEHFEELSHAYINKYPSHFRSIRWFGDQLEHFLMEHPDYHTFPYLAELAKLEWTMTLTFDAADSCLVEIEDMMNLSPESWVDMRLIAHPSTRLVNFSWNVVQIWQDSSQKPEKNQTPTSWIFWRKDLVNQYCSLPIDEAFALDAMLKGMTFGEICEGLCQWIDEQKAAERAASLLKGWISSGLIAEVKT